MTPDRPENAPFDEESEHSVLDDTGSIDTAALGLLGGGTEQVSVSFAASTDDDDLDDADVVGDEVPFAAEVPDVPVITAEAEIVEPLDEDWTTAETGETFIAARDSSPATGETFIAVGESFPETGETFVVAEEASPATGETTVAHRVATPATGSTALPVRESFPSFDETFIVHDPTPPRAHAAEAGAWSPSARDTDRAATLSTAGSVDAPAAPVVTGPSPRSGDERRPNADPASSRETPSTASAFPFDEPKAPDAAPAVSSDTSSTPPPTRWAAQHPSEPVRPNRVRAVERVHTRTDVTLTSKRLGEFEGGRESADLLTADRLLDPNQIVKPEPEGAWQQFVYSISGHRINLGDGKRARARKALDRRIAAPLTGGARFVPVLSRKGGVGKTTITTLLGMALAGARDDRIIAVDANPDRGTLAERIARASGKTVRDLVRARGEVVGFNDLSNIVARDETRLDVVASDSDPRVSEAFSDRDYHDVASLAAHYYSIVLTDTGTGIVHSVMEATLDLADQLVIVSGLSIDEARLASETLTWLETNGYAEQVSSAVVVLNNARPGIPIVRQDELEKHFRSRVREVVRVPYDPQIAAGAAITFRDLQPATRQAARELAAAVVEGLRSLAPAA